MFNLGNAKKNLLAINEKSNKYSVSNYTIDLNNENDSHTIIIKNVLDPTCILDVGCGVGYIGAKLKELYPQCKVDGIEIDSEAVKIVKKIYDNVYDFSIEDNDSKSCKNFFKNKIKYDYIILADLIEHLENPGDIIYKLSKMLKKNGKIIVSIPNIAHINIISGLINGHFNYNYTGIIDSTHLRFFTPASFFEFINNINERYDTYLSVKCIGKTYAKEDERNNCLFYTVLKDDMYVFQNIFEITLSQIKITNILEKSDNNRYKEINDIYLECLNDIKEKNEILKSKEITINDKNEIIKVLTQQMKNYENQLNSIFNSKSWKLTKPLRKIISFFHKK